MKHVFFDISLGSRRAILAKEAESLGFKVVDFLEIGVDIYVTQKDEDIMKTVAGCSSRRGKRMIGQNEGERTTAEVKDAIFYLILLKPNPSIVLTQFVF